MRRRPPRLTPAMEDWRSTRWPRAARWQPEAKLAREAEISYATIALATDYDCWHEGHEDVSKRWRR